VVLSALDFFWPKHHYSRDLGGAADNLGGVFLVSLHSGWAEAILPAEQSRARREDPDSGRMKVSRENVRPR
jgi:hypothetical protein